MKQTDSNSILRFLPLIIGLVPFFGVTGSYWIASSHGLIGTCIPYIDGCTSISATGRYAPASYLFRAVQMPLAALLFVLWPLTTLWLRALGDDARRRQAVIVAAGTAGAIALVIYVTFLGTKEPFYEFMRRFGVYVYFLGTAIAQLTVARAYRQTPGAGRLGESLLILAIAPFVLGITNLIVKPLLADPDPMENSIEWIAALLMQIYYVVLWTAWRRSGFAPTVSVR